MDKQPQQKIIVIEDDEDIANLVALHLSDLGFEVDKAETGKKGAEMVLLNAYALVILDRVLPDMDGLEICRAIRSRNSSLPVVVLTSKSDEVERIVGLELGADDYVTKPFSIRELVARVKAVLRRTATSTQASEDKTAAEIRVGDLLIDPRRCKVFNCGAEVNLTATEFNLLYFLACSPGRVFSREDLLTHVWGYDSAGYEHTVNSHINRLRSKIEKDPAFPRYVLTVRGKGYCFATEESAGGSSGESV